MLVKRCLVFFLLIWSVTLASAVPIGARMLTVPNVVGMSLSGAKAALVAAGLTVGRITTLPNASIPKNRVVEQQPPSASRVQEPSVASLVISFPPQDDDDNDGLPDAWEYAHFGNLSPGGNDDPDKDGCSNAQEYLVGTNPNNAGEAPVPAGNFFAYDAFGRIIVKQIALEPE